MDNNIILIKARGNGLIPVSSVTSGNVVRRQAAARHSVRWKKDNFRDNPGISGILNG